MTECRRMGGMRQGLTTKYGFKHWTSTPCCLTSSASAVEKVSMKALEAEYVASIGEGTTPEKEPMLRTRPRLL